MTHGSNGRPLLSADMVHNVAFGRPPIGQRGYHKGEVDAFLDDVEATIRWWSSGRTTELPAAPGAGPLITPDMVQGVVFNKPPMGRRGYHEGEVDAFLDDVQATIAQLLDRPGRYE